MTGSDATIELVVDEVIPLTGTITEFRLRDPAGRALPGYTAGAHLRVRVAPGGTADWRHYSLINGTVGATLAPEVYRIAVRREDNGLGGSRWMHTMLKPGSRLLTSQPRNAFVLDLDAEDAVLIAGGIGVTPIVSMAAALAGAGRRYRVHYSARDTRQLAFAQELRGIAGAHLSLYADEGVLPVLDIAALLQGLRPGQPLYVCGPAGMIDAVLAQAYARGWAREDIHFERFAAPPAAASDTGFEVELRQSGRTLTVAAGESILDAMLEAGLDPLYDCKRGECGLCRTTVLEGALDHRDYCLSESERQAGNVMQICVSRAGCGRLVLDA
ncbi:2Fe-2S iron-sulfur cluster-binding protein [Paraburkholderia sp. BR10936]|uniref:PDR/VanB family oxidoreductase n=1 Tax=Paraburkholderia sp. BR10936 TaxID=3236993 RepID=UPI0034D1F46D